MIAKKFQLELYRFADKKPKHGQEILHFSRMAMYDVAAVPAMARAEYRWFGKDEKGYTGEEILYDPDDDPSPPEGCVLELTLSGMGFRNTDLWCLLEDVDNMLEEADHE